MCPRRGGRLDFEVSTARGPSTSRDGSGSVERISPKQPAEGLHLNSGWPHIQYMYHRSTTDVDLQQQDGHIGYDPGRAGRTTRVLGPTACVLSTSTNTPAILSQH